MFDRIRGEANARRFVQYLRTPNPDEVLVGFDRLWVCGRCGESEFNNTGDLYTRPDVHDRALAHAATHDGDVAVRDQTCRR